MDSIEIELETNTQYENDYENLENKPKINNIEIDGEKTGSDYELEDLTNKVSEITEDISQDETKYPNVKAVVNYVEEHSGGGIVERIQLDGVEQVILDGVAYLDGYTKSNADAKFATNDNLDLVKDDVDEALEGVASNIEAIDTVDGKVDAVDTAINKSMVSDISITQQNDNVSLGIVTKNIKTDAQNTTTKAIPLSDSTKAGLQSPSDYNQIRQNTSDIAILKGQSIRLAYSVKTNPTAGEIQAFVESKGYTQDKWTQIAVVVVDTNYVWRYYTEDGWVQQSDVISLFTNSEAGIIKGSTTDGKVFAENDGTGSVNGWDNLKNRVSSVESSNATKLEKVETSGSVRLYGVDTDGSQGMVSASQSATQNAVPIYGASGVLKVGAPLANGDAATKKYVDDAIAEIAGDIQGANTQLENVLGV